MATLRSLRHAFAAVFAFALLAIGATDAHATHFRYGTIRWEKTAEDANTITILVTTESAWRCTFFVTAPQTCSNLPAVVPTQQILVVQRIASGLNLFQNNLRDDAFKVKAESLSVRFMGRTAGDVLDVGFGFDMYMFHGKAFDRFTRFAVEPVRVSVAPFVALNNSARARAFHLTVAPKIILGSVNQDDFCNTSACSAVPRQFSARVETLWSTTFEVDILTLIRGN